MGQYYDDLLELCGFEIEDINKERPRAEKAFEILELGPADMATAQSWVGENHDVELMGVRKALGAWLKELIDLVLAKDEGKKILYATFPSIQGPGMAMAAASEQLYCVTPDVVLCYTLGQIFNKLNPMIEAGEQNGLPPGHGLCSLQQVRTGGLAKGIIPVPDLAVNPSYYCDLGSKAAELQSERFGRPDIYIDGCLDSAWGEYPDCLPEKVEYLGAQINKFFDSVKEIMGIKVTQDAWRKAMSVSLDYYRGLGEITGLLQADPLPVSATDVQLLTLLALACTGRGVTEGRKAQIILSKEIKERIDKGIGVVEKGSPKVFLFFAHLADPSITRMIENTGLAIPATLISVPPPKAKFETKYTTLGEIIAEREMRLGAFHSGFGFTKRWAEIIEACNVDGAIYNYQFSCRPIASMAHYLKKWSDENTNIPTLSIEADVCDSRTHNASALRTRVETFAQMLRERKKDLKV